MFHSERQVLQSQQDELQHGSVVGGFGVSEPGVEQPVSTDTDEPGNKGLHYSHQQDQVTLLLWIQMLISISKKSHLDTFNKQKWLKQRKTKPLSTLQTYILICICPCVAWTLLPIPQWLMGTRQSRGSSSSACPQTRPSFRMKWYMLLKSVLGIDDKPDDQKGKILHFQTSGKLFYLNSLKFEVWNF